jgi:hypothetical protein
MTINSETVDHCGARGRVVRPTSALLRRREIFVGRHPLRYAPPNCCQNAQSAALALLQETVVRFGGIPPTVVQ